MNEEINREQMVTISLRHYDELNRTINSNMLLNDRLSKLENKLDGLYSILNEITCKIQ